MKKIILASLLAASTSVLAQTTLSDNWNVVPSGTDGRDGWFHNSAWSGPWSRAPQGDIGSHVEWRSDAGNSFIAGLERASGAEDKFVAPQKFFVNGGNLLALTQATLTYKYNRLARTTGNVSPLGVQVVITSGTSTLTRTFSEAELPAGFYDDANLGTWFDLSVDLIGDPIFWVPFTPDGETPKTREDILSSVDGILLDIDIRSGGETNAIDDVRLAWNDGTNGGEVLSDFNQGPQSLVDGRAGWIRNRAEDGFAPAPQGDVLARVLWVGDSTNGALEVIESGQGSNDYFVAPSRYIVNGGRFDLLSTGTFSFSFARVLPAAVTNVANRNAVILRLYSGSSFVTYTWPVANFAEEFWTSTLAPVTLTANLMDRAAWAPSSGATVEGVLANVTAMLIDGEVVSGSEVNVIDDFQFTYAIAPALTATVVFNDYLGPRALPTPVTFTFYDAGTENVAATRVVAANGDGTYTMAAPGTGTYDVAVNTGTWLRRKVSGIDFGAGDATATLALINGDIVDSGAIDLDDFLVLAANYEANVGDPGVDPNADLNYDGVINLDDFLILAANYEVTGD